MSFPMLVKRTSDYCFSSSSSNILKLNTGTPTQPNAGSPSEMCSITVLNNLEGETIDSAVGEDGANQL